MQLTTSTSRMTATKGSPASFRARRHKREAQRTRANLRLLLAADTRVRPCGADHIVAGLAENYGFERHDLIITRVAINRRTITLIITPRRIWHRPEYRTELLFLKKAALNLGIDVLLVPEGALRRQPRLDNAQSIVAASDVAVSMTQRLRVEMHVMASGGAASLEDCASILPDHRDPVGAVLALVHARRLHLPLNEPITGASILTSIGGPPPTVSVERAP